MESGERVEVVESVVRGWRVGDKSHNDGPVASVEDTLRGTGLDPLWHTGASPRHSKWACFLQTGGRK